jgi:hypothetical protein
MPPVVDAILCIIPRSRNVIEMNWCIHSDLARLACWNDLLISSRPFGCNRSLESAWCSRRSVDGEYGGRGRRSEPGGAGAGEGQRAQREGLKRARWCWNKRRTVCAHGKDGRGRGKAGLGGTGAGEGGKVQSLLSSVMSWLL